MGRVEIATLRVGVRAKKGEGGGGGGGEKSVKIEVNALHLLHSSANGQGIVRTSIYWDF